MSDTLPQKSHFLVYQAEDGTFKIDVRLEEDTVWLTQPLIAELFQTSIPNVSMHIRNIYEEGELTSEATVKKFLTVRKEGNREVRRDLEYYNLDMIISVGYRVESRIATRERQSPDWCLDEVISWHVCQLRDWRSWVFFNFHYIVNETASNA